MSLRALLFFAAALAGCTTVSPRPEVDLIVAGPPVDAESTGRAYDYETPPPASGDADGGRVSQPWSILGREDRAASIDNEYGVAACPPLDPPASGEAEVLARITAAARDHRVVIINESHVVTRHRDFSRKVIAALRPLGYTVLAAEAFTNLPEGTPDPVERYSNLPYIDRRIGYYIKEPVFAAMLREAKALGYRFAAYEQVFDPNRHRPGENDDWRFSIRDRETEQASNLAALIATIDPDEKLIVHVGYAHASEAVVVDKDGWENAWMAARLKRDHGIDPLTIGQAECHGSAQSVRLAKRSSGKDYDLYVDHPPYRFRNSRPDWRFADGNQSVAIPAELRPVDGPLVIEAFAEGEPFDAVPVDRVWVEPGEDVSLLLKPGRYIVRAVIPAPPAD